MPDGLSLYLSPTAILDSDHPAVRAFARDAVRAAADTAPAKAVRLYYAVRDGIWYDPYQPFHRPEHYRASHVLAVGRAFCVGKAGLLCALGRACGIPARVGFADVRNHLTTRQLRDFLGSDLFVFHGYTEFWLEGRWVKATPAFNVELCRRHRVAPLEFDGCTDSHFSRLQRGVAALHGICQGPWRLRRHPCRTAGRRLGRCLRPGSCSRVDHGIRVLRRSFRKAV